MGNSLRLITVVQFKMLRDSAKESIQVTIRVRPFSEKQLVEDPRSCVQVEQANSLQLFTPNQLKKFTFDSICFEESQEGMFERVGRKCALDCLEGYNCTIFAYGQTGAGKTYTMMGVSAEHEQYFPNRGLVPRTLEFLFECIGREQQSGVSFAIRCSFLEIYNEQIIDLLNKNNSNLQLRQDTRKGVYVEGLTEEYISRSEEAMDILYKGSKSRHVGSTFYNETSSRSHSVFSLHIESKFTKSGVVTTRSRQFHFIDLAGSERTKQSTGERLKEGCNINKSLMNLAAVINSLSQVSQGKSQHVNYRNSKLTFLLKDSLGGNSKTNLIANISPAATFFQETLSTLGFARRAKLIKRQKALINEDASGNLESMKNQIKRLKQEVINLMGQVQKGEAGAARPAEAPNQMTSIMHQYVSEEIDKQTKLELQILRLNERIKRLQEGIKRYSASDSHLRMVIAVYEDKINRLSKTEQVMQEQAMSAPQQEEAAEYFRHERKELMKELDVLRKHAEGGRFIKQILKEARVVREQGEDDTLTELLTKNTTFLSQIQAKLDLIKPERLSQSNEQMSKKITEIETEFIQKEEEYKERLDQASLELNDFRTRGEENEKMLEEAISEQIAMETRAKKAESEVQVYESQLKSQQTLTRNVEESLEKVKFESSSVVSELQEQLKNKESEAQNIRKEASSFKAKLEKALENEAALKEECGVLEEQKYEAEKAQMASIQEFKEHKNNLVKAESEINIMKEKVEELTSENELLRGQLEKSQESLAQEKKHHRAVQETLNERSRLIMSLEQTTSSLQKQVERLMTELEVSSKNLQESQDSLEKARSQMKEMQQSLSNQLSAKDEKLSEVLKMMSESELNGSATEGKLNQTTIELIDAHQKVELLEIKLKKAIEQSKERSEKERASFEAYQRQAADKQMMYEEAVKKGNDLKKEIEEARVKFNRLSTAYSQVESEMEELKGKEEQLTKVKQSEKQYKIQVVELRNELFVSQQNSVIETDALKSQIELKEQHIAKIEKESSRTKSKLEKQVSELTEDMTKDKQLYQAQQESLKKSTESHLLAKEKKITELKVIMEERDTRIRELQQTQSIKQVQIDNLSAYVASIQKELQEKASIIAENSQKIDELKLEIEQVMADCERRLEESESMHGEQLDTKNELIEKHISKIQALKKEIECKAGQITSLGHQVKQSAEQNAKISSLKQKLEESLQQTIGEVDELKKQAASYKNQIDLNGQDHTQMALSLARMQQNLEERQGQISLLEEEKQKGQRQMAELTQQFNELNVSKETTDRQLQELDTMFKDLKHEHEKVMEEKIELQQVSSRTKMVAEELTNKLSSTLATLSSRQNQLHSIQQAYNQLAQEMKTLASQIEINQARQAQQQETIQQLNNQKVKLRQQLEFKVQSLISENSELKRGCDQMAENNDRTAEKTVDLTASNNQLTKCLETERITTEHLRATNKSLEQNIRIIEQQRRHMSEEISKAKSDTQCLAQQLNTKDKVIHNLEAQSVSNNQKIVDLETKLHQTNAQAQALTSFKQKWQLKFNDCEILRASAEEERREKEILFEEVGRAKDGLNNLKQLLDNKSAQNTQLQRELEEKDAIYKRLVDKLARTESEHKKAATNSEHYLKTIELLEKSRAEQLELRRVNDELRKGNNTLKDQLQQSQRSHKETKKESEIFGLSMHKRMEESQNQIFDLQKDNIALVKEKKSLQKAAQEGEQLKEEIRSIRSTAAKLTQKHEENEHRLKKANLDYLQLEKEFEDYKRSQVTGGNDERTTYINRLKAEIAALKTEKVLLTDQLNKEREEKTKLKADLRYGRDTNEGSLKLDLDKKISQNRNLQEVIFEIVTHLKISVNEPKTKLEALRTVILGTIKEKSTETKVLKQKLRECEEELHRMKSNAKEQKVLGSYNREQEYRYDRNQKEGSFLSNNSRQKIKQIENYYARVRQPK